MSNMQTGLSRDAMGSKVVVRAVFVVLMAALILWAGSFWFRTPAPSMANAVTLIVETNSPGGGPAFRLRNDGKPAILLGDVFVETNSPTGWQSFSDTEPSHMQQINTGGALPLGVFPPTDGTPWRVRVLYRTEMTGARLLRSKVAFVIRYHSIPGSGFWIGPETNSCVSAVIAK
jgi:hypothetical protein